MYRIQFNIGRYSKDPKEMFNFSRKRVLESVEESLRRLQVDYIDVVQVR